MFSLSLWAQSDISLNQFQESGNEKQKTHYPTAEAGFKQKWIEFLADSENNRNFHRYSPEKNSVTRLCAKLSRHTFMLTGKLTAR
ncbi:hypothetical protein INT47_009216 [Mucor saturninus]|uniref:Uncharacterized protein n=1 Tax=Mucor saturninus TaxID=64648 RepID=A0A8H7RM22_9FUNG|nr:hypothetical protein INT47_009216 [Mucor saturninus]